MNTETGEIRRLNDEQLAILNGKKPGLWVPIQDRELERILRKLSKRERKIVMAHVKPTHALADYQTALTDEPAKPEPIEDVGEPTAFEKEYGEIAGLLRNRASAYSMSPTLTNDFRYAAYPDEDSPDMGWDAVLDRNAAHKIESLTKQLEGHEGLIADLAVDVRSWLEEFEPDGHFTVKDDSEAYGFEESVALLHRADEATGGEYLFGESGDKSLARLKAKGGTA